MAWEKLSFWSNLFFYILFDLQKHTGKKRLCPCRSVPLPEAAPSLPSPPLPSSWALLCPSNTSSHPVLGKGGASSQGCHWDHMPCRRSAQTHIPLSTAAVRHQPLPGWSEMLKEVFRYSQRIIFQEWSEILSKPLSKFSFQNKGFFGTGSMGLEVTGAGLCHTFITYANEHQLLHRTNTLLSNAIWPFDTRSSAKTPGLCCCLCTLFKAHLSRNTSRLYKFSFSKCLE